VEPSFYLPLLLNILTCRRHSVIPVVFIWCNHCIGGIMASDEISLAEIDRRWVRDVYRGDRLPEFTLKAVLVGAFLAMLIICSNIYMGMKTGWTEAGSIISAILAFAILKSLRQSISVLENNIAQTIGSAGGSLGNVVNVVPALILLGFPLTGWQIFIWVFCVSFLGVFFAVPLRRQIVVIENLRFPSGTACAETIKAIHAHGNEALKKARLLGLTGAASAVFTWFREAIPKIIPAHSTVGLSIGGHSLESLTLGVSWSPMMFGAGLLIGPKVGISLLVGAVITWGVLAPWLSNSGVIAELSYRNITHWTMWTGTAIMVTAGLTSTALKARIVVRAFRSMRHAAGGAVSQLEFPFKVWLAGLTVASAVLVTVMYFLFGLNPLLGLISIVLSFVLALVAVRATGETDINPVGAMGHITQLIFGALSPGSVTTNLIAAGVTSAGASESGDMMQDLKTGYLLGATPRKQVWGQFIGVIAGSLVAAPVFLVVIKAYGIGTPSMPAPAAVVWEGLARLLAQGLGALPRYTGTAVVIAAVVGALLAVIDSTRFRKYNLSPIGLGVAMVVPAYYCISMFLGSMMLVAMRRASLRWTETYYSSLASGGIAGEGIMGVLTAALIATGIIPH